MEISASYDAPVKGSTRWQVYGGPVAEPALGPVAFMHRVVGHAQPHCADRASLARCYHISLWGRDWEQLYGARWKAEASAFNGREPDETRTDFDWPRLIRFQDDSRSFRRRGLALQVSAGRLDDVERDVERATRLTSSATYHRALGEAGIWASTVAWGMNTEHDRGSHALLVETSVTIADRDAWFGRFEVVGKSAHDLDLPGEQQYAVSKLQGGYTRYFTKWSGVRPGVGATMSLGWCLLR
jgi:hypothetical protein